MSKEGPFVVESFVTVGSFDYDCTPPPPNASPTNVHAPTINDQQPHVQLIEVHQFCIPPNHEHTK